MKPDSDDALSRLQRAHEKQRDAALAGNSGASRDAEREATRARADLLLARRGLGGTSSLEERAARWHEELDKPLFTLALEGTLTWPQLRERLEQLRETRDWRRIGLPEEEAVAVLDDPGLSRTYLSAMRAGRKSGDLQESGLVLAARAPNPVLESKLIAFLVAEGILDANETHE